MNLVNKYYISDIIATLSYYDLDDIEEKYDEIDIDIENNAKIIIRVVLFPNYYFKSKEYKIIFKNSLKYFLNTENINFRQLCDDEMISIPCTQNPRTFFKWIWEVFYNETYHLNEKELKEFKISNKKSEFSKINQITIRKTMNCFRKISEN